MSKVKPTDIYKDFAQRLRKYTLQNVYIIVVSDDGTEQLKKYVRLLSEVEFNEDNYNVFYGAIKKILNSFVYFYSFAINRFIIETDKYLHVTNRAELLGLLQKTIGLHEDQQIKFAKDYLPVNSTEERQIYDEIQSMYDAFMQKLCDLRLKIEKLDKQEKVDDFAKEHFKYAMDRTSDIYDFAHVYIALMVIDRLKEIRISLEEILLHLKNNLGQIRNDSEQSMNSLMNNLYDQHKELLMASRKYRLKSVDIAEIHRSIEKTRDRIDVFKYEVPQSRLEDEVEYWKQRVSDFEVVAQLLMKLKNEQEDLEKQIELYKSRSCTEYPGSKSACWTQIGKSYNKRSAMLKDKIIEAGKALVTFFAIKGTDRVFYKSDTGKYYVDEHDHQVYVQDFLLRHYHTNCQGDLIEVPDKSKYSFDQNGRYVKDDKGEKVYQIAACTSLYRLDEDGLLQKVTKDCGHSDAVNRKCKMRIKDPTDVEVLPDVDPIDIKSSLDPEVIKYLWDTFGHILPFALRDVGHDHSKNPIHHLAHRLLHYQHTQTREDLENKKKESQAFRANVIKERKDKKAEEAAAWKAKQVKRRKPEESDDLLERIVYEDKMADRHFVESLNYFYS